VLNIVVAELGDMAGNFTQKEILAMIGRTFTLQFVITLLFGLGIISYINSQKCSFNY